jgi:predicted nucleic acid-binding protein
MTSQPPEQLIICDASPLILLAKISHADLVLKLAHEVWIPDVVWEELTLKSGAQPEIPTLVALFSSCVRQSDEAIRKVFQTQVDAGEAAALALAIHQPHALLLMDDRRGRLLAANQGLRCTGTLGLLLRAKRQGHVKALSPLIQSLRLHGMFLSAELENEALHAAGEEMP